MASKIYPYNIDITYPIAGQDNDTQGFRTNFNNIKNNFVTAMDEISDIQANVTLLQAQDLVTTYGNIEVTGNLTVTTLITAANSSANLNIQPDKPGNVVIGSNLYITTGNALLMSANAGLGYTSGTGGTVTQTSSRTQGVTINKINGAITLVSAAGSTSYNTFTVTNNTVGANDLIIVNQKSGTDKYETFITNVYSGSFNITFATTGGTTTEQPVFNFSVIKGSST